MRRPVSGSRELIKWVGQPGPAKSPRWVGQGEPSVWCRTQWVARRV